jgi:hypothetical protein
MSAATSSSLQCGPDVEYYYKSIEKFSHHGNKYAKIEVWEDVAKVCLVEEVRRDEVRRIAATTVLRRPRRAQPSPRLSSLVTH